MYYSETLGKIITDKALRIVRIGARPTWHIYGIKKVEYHKRMRELGFLAREADVLVKDFKQGLITKVTLILRRVKFDLSLCCVNVSPGTIIKRVDNNVGYCEIKRSFKNTLDEWVSEITTDAWNKYTIECNLLSDGNVWEAEKCGNDSIGFIDGIKIISKKEIKNPDESLKGACDKIKVLFNLKYKDWGIGAWNKWSKYKKSVKDGVVIYEN